MHPTPVHQERAEPAVRLVGEDFDGAYDDIPVRAVAAA